MEALFGYGSLILPMSVLGRFDEELRSRIDELRENGGASKEFLNYYMSERPVEKWKASDLHMVPAKIYGLKRSYSLEVYDSGNMLVAEEASKDEFINGVVIFPLDKNQVDKISETEEGYRTVEKKRDEIESYIPEEKLSEKGVEIPDKVKVYVADEEVEEVNKDTERTRSEPYHQYIVNGIRMIAEEWYTDEDQKQKLVEDFMSDFRKTTFEIDENMEWKRMIQK
ncbi:hypothetical protein ACK3SF_00750 [Candidatus Nanosalina sp. VS9-1]|uniref:hypothetical protein n=1 Tax=Candidatus Nanosalina sp. VS9-1 TaxID=3388566 RepID=UPI0039E07731